MTNVHLHPGEETLMAYADGELDEDVALAVENALENDPALIRELVAFTRSRRLARAVMSQGYDTPSGHAPAAISPLKSAAAPIRPWRAFPGWERAGAHRTKLAAAALLVVACGLGYVLGAWPAAGPAPTTFGYLDNPDMAAALHETASGASRSVAGGTLDTIASYRLQDGTLCRDYVLARDGGRAEAVACRVKGEWRTMAAIAKPATSGYTPASGESVIDAYLRELGAGEPLSPEDESRLLSSR